MAYDNRPWDFSQLPKGLEIPRLVNPALEALTNPRRGISIIPSDENQHSKYTAVSGLQDSKGYVWLGTYAGIIRFDEGKNRVEVYDKKVAPGVMYEIYEDRKGRIWFANQYGSVYVYSNADGSWGSYNLLNQLPQSDLNELVLDHEGKKLFTISAIYEDNSGQLMFGTSQGLIVFSEKQNKWRLFTRENSKLISNIVVAIFEDRNGRIWLGTSTGIMVLEQ
jgi:ligand-binding sensor domain-containing protein